MTDFLVNCPKWECRKCLLSFSQADKHISQCIFLLSARHTHTHRQQHHGCSFASLVLDFSLSFSFHFLDILHQRSLLHTHKLSKSHFSGTDSGGTSVDGEKNILFPQRVKA